MSKSLIKDDSLKCFQNEEYVTYEKNVAHNLPKFFIQTNDRKQNYTEKSIQWHKTLTQKSQSQIQQKIASPMNFSSHHNMTKNEITKPLNDLLKSNKYHFSEMKSNESKQKTFYRTMFTQMNESRISRPRNFSVKQSQSKDCKNNFKTQVSGLKQASQKSLRQKKLIQTVDYVKNLQSETKQTHSRSCSGKKKGLECTLHEKSLEKKINQSAVKTSKKMITIKKKFEKTEVEWGRDEDAAQKQIKKVLLKKRNNHHQLTLNNTNIFNSVMLEKSKSKQSQSIYKKKVEQNTNSGSRPKIGQNIRSVSKNKKQAFTDLTKSMGAIKQACRNKKFSTVREQGRQKSRQNPRLSVKKQHSSQKNVQSIQGSAKGKKVILNQKIQNNLNKIHDKYKFILNYLTDFEIIGKLNGFQIGGVEECKWILLIIDYVYETIRHSQQSKLKGIQFSRNYSFITQINTDQHINTVNV